MSYRYLVRRGALLEHKMFNLFYNWPLTIRNRMTKRSQLRSTMPPRHWHVALCSIAAMAIFVVVDLIYLGNSAGLPGLKQIWGLALTVPLISGAAVTLGAAGAELKHRIIGAALCGVTAGVFSTLISAGINPGNPLDWSEIMVISLWRIFIFSIFSVVRTADHGNQLAGTGCRRTEDRGQKSEDRGQKSEDRSLMTDYR